MKNIAVLVNYYVKKTTTTKTGSTPTFTIAKFAFRSGETKEVGYNSFVLEKET